MPIPATPSQKKATKKWIENNKEQHNEYMRNYMKEYMKTHYTDEAKKKKRDYYLKMKASRGLQPLPLPLPLPQI